MSRSAESGAPRIRAGHPVSAFVHRWWQGRAGFAGVILDLGTAPLEAVYRLLANRFHRAYRIGLRPVTRVGAPVISVGNIAVGGTGKTPVAAWLAEELTKRGARPALLHGGYAEDEPALHRLWHPGIPVIVNRDRVAGAALALDGGATVLVLDDGFQHRRVARDIDLVLISAENWTPRPRLLPRGPWREAPSALERADLVAVVRKTGSAIEARRIAEEVARMAPGPEIVRIALVPGGWRRLGGEASPTPGGADPGPIGPALALTAVAAPEAFVSQAMAAGARVEDAIFYPDHHVYDAADLDRVTRLAAGRAVVTTAKDAVKLDGWATDLEVWILDQRVVVEDGLAVLENMLDGLIR